jgi:hypothetical protein
VLGRRSAGVTGDSKPFSLFPMLCTELTSVEITRGLIAELGGSMGSLLGAGVITDLTAGDPAPKAGRAGSEPVSDFFAKKPRMLACFPLDEAVFGVFFWDPLGVDISISVWHDDDVRA